MKFISIDVGIKNLSFCLFNKDNVSNHYDILKWDNIDLSEKYDKKCIEIEKNIICGKPAKFIKESKCYCIKHSKKTSFLLPNPDFQISSLNKQKIQELIKIADKHNIEYTKPCKKTELINIIHEFSKNNCYEYVNKINASKVDLVTIGKNIQQKFDLLFEEQLDTIETIIIENQIGPLANKMKTIQGMIAQYFIMKNNNIKIEFISSTNKLKDFINVLDDKLDYKKRKQLGINSCLEVISSDLKYSDWENFIKTHKKKDDLADSFLQGLWYLKHKL